MFWLFVFLMLFMAWRTFVYFREGRAIAGLAASFGVLLFAGAIFVSFADTTNADRQMAEMAENAGSQRTDNSQPVISDYEPGLARDDGFTPESEL